MEKKLTPEAIAELKEKAKQEIEAEKPDVAIALVNRVLMDAPDAEAYDIRADAHLLGENYNSCFQDMDIAILIEPQNADLYIKRGVFSLILERCVDAKLDFDHAVKLNPSDPNFYFYRSLTLSALGEPTAALGDLKKCLELNQDKETESVARIQRAEILMGQGRNIDAFGDLTIALELDNSDAEVHKRRGIIANQIGEYRLAYYDLSIMPLCQPTSENYMLRSEAAAGLGYITSADNDRFISALFQQPCLQEVVEKLISQLNEANYDASLKLLDEIVSLLPQDVSEILYLRAKMKLELNQKAEAIADLDAAIQADPLNSLKALLCRVKLQVDMNDGDHSQVTSDFREILRRETDAAKVYMATGVLKLTAGDPMFAVAYLNAAMEKSGNILNPLLPFYRGLAKVRMQNYNDALLDFDRAIEIEDNENITQCVVNLGLRSALHGILEDYDKALSDIKKAISMCMEMDDGGVPLCMILWEIRRKVQENLGLEEPSTGHDYIDFFDMMVPSTERLEHTIAIYDLTIRIEQEEHSIDDYLARGLAYVEIDEPEAGIADLTRVIEANPTCVKAYLARGKAYRQINQPDDSLNDFRKAIEIDPDCEDADHERALTLMESIQEE